MVEHQLVSQALSIIGPLRKPGMNWQGECETGRAGVPQVRSSLLRTLVGIIFPFNVPVPPT